MGKRRTDTPVAASGDSSDQLPDTADLDPRDAAPAPATTAEAAIFAQVRQVARERGLEPTQVLRAARAPGLAGLPPSLLATVAALLDVLLEADSGGSGAVPANRECDDHGQELPGARDDG